MASLINTSYINERIKILIFGSYHPKNKPILDNLVTFLKEKGFRNTSLAQIPIYDSIKNTYEEKMATVLTKIEEKMIDAHFNLFILFEEENESTLIELTCLVKSEYYSEKKETLLVVLPRNFNVSMLAGLIGQKRVNVFRYDYKFEIFKYCLVFIKRNLINL